MDIRIVIYVLLGISVAVGFIFCACVLAGRADAQELKIKNRKKISKLIPMKHHSRVTQKIIRKMNEIIDYINEE